MDRREPIRIPDQHPMTIFTNARCIVLACESNHGDDGCVCWYASHGLPCGHPKWRGQWLERNGCTIAVDLDELPALKSITARVSATLRDTPALTPEMARARAQQLDLELVRIK